MDGSWTLKYAHSNSIKVYTNGKSQKYWKEEKDWVSFTEGYFIQ